MTIVEPPEPETSPPATRPRARHDVALWAAASAFFGSLLAVGIFDVFNPDQMLEYLGALLVAAITGGAVYSKERLDLAKREAQAE